MLPADWTSPGRAALSPRAAQDPFAGDTTGLNKWLTGSVVLHVTVAAAIIGGGIYMAMHHGDTWGGNSGAAGEIHATLVSNAPSVPIPSPQTPTENVLATPDPSPVPTPPAPAPKAAAPPPDAIPIPEKTTPPEKAKPQPKEVKTPPKADSPRTQPLAPLKNLVIPKPGNRVPTGEAAPANIPRNNPNAAAGASPVSVGGDFGARFPWYVDIIKRKAAQNWYRAEVAPNTPAGAKVFLTFDVAKDGHPGNVRIEKSSGSASLDTSALRAMQRVDTFGPLPGGYNGSRLSVEYYFEY